MNTNDLNTALYEKMAAEQDIPAAGTTVGRCEGNPYPTLQTFITGIDTPFAEGGTAFLRRTFLRFFFLPVSLSFACPYRII